MKGWAGFKSVSVLRKEFDAPLQSAHHTTRSSNSSSSSPTLQAVNLNPLPPPDSDSNSKESPRHFFSSQLSRRTHLALSRTYLLTSTLTPEIDWVLWIDVDVVAFDEGLVETLLGWSGGDDSDSASEEEEEEARGDSEGLGEPQGGKVEVVVPNCMWRSYDEIG